MTIILYLVTVTNIGDTLGSRRQSPSLMRGWHKTCLLAASTLHISFIPGPSSGSGGHPGPGSLHLSRFTMLLICSLSSIHLTRPRQCSHAHTPQELSSSGWHEISDLTAAWRHGHDQAGSVQLYLMACQQLKFSCFQEKVLASTGPEGKTHLNGIF